VVRHGPNDLYAGTTSGLYSIDDDGKFHLVSGITRMCWFLLSLEHSLLAATIDGVFQVEKNVKHKVNDVTSFVIHRCQKEVNRVWVGTIQGLISLYRDQGNNCWSEEYQFESITDHIRTIVEDQKGNMWLGTLTKGVLNVNFPADLHQPEVTRYDTTHGLPRGEANVFMAAGHVMVGTDTGLFRFDEKINGFIPDYTLGDEFANGSRNVFRLMEDRNKHIWFHSNQRNFQAIAQQDGSFVSIGKPFLRIPAAQVNCIYFDPSDDATWFASHKGLFRYDTRTKKNYHQNFKMVIHKVLINGNLVFDGYTPITQNGFFPIIDYHDRNIRFMFAAPFFEAEQKTRYRFYLEGYDNGWSQWTAESQKDYTNLDPGSYTFRVQAKNIYKNLSEEAIYQFKVLPPWYQNWWAYLIYFFLVFQGVYFIVKWRSWKLVREKQKLEQVS
jgi:hypothetical protein